MSSIDIFVENVNNMASRKRLTTYKQLAEHLHIGENTLKCWENKSRSPSLNQIDRIANVLNIYSYALLESGNKLLEEPEIVINNSRERLVMNLQRIFIDNGRTTWNDKVALFYGFLSEDVLKSYFRTRNFKTPPLKRIDEMAEALGIPPYMLIKGGMKDEKKN